ncbi:hypothetical protein [Pseudonocardia adelaidensis]|uniref:Secreted protein n=1 Tax=Pseudonocardia adelaidensis TaxID=648754 RepID=A0ABP9P706_9PSEU
MTTVLRRSIGAVAAMLGVGACLAIGAPGTAYADTVTGKSCGEKHEMSPEYYDMFGNAAPCTADFVASAPGTARITIDVVSSRGHNRDDPHNWSFDLFTCEGSVLPSEPPRTFTCDFEAGPHTVYVDKNAGDRFIDLKVDY